MSPWVAPFDRATRDVVVAFEADGTDVYGEWSVSLIGVASQLTDVDAMKRAEALSVPTWSAREYRFAAISTELISGRSRLTVPPRPRCRGAWSERPLVVADHLSSQLSGYALCPTGSTRRRTDRPSRPALTATRTPRWSRGRRFPPSNWRKLHCTAEAGPEEMGTNVACPTSNATIALTQVRPAGNEIWPSPAIFG